MESLAHISTISIVFYHFLPGSQVRTCRTKIAIGAQRNSTRFGCWALPHPLLTWASFPVKSTITNFETNASKNRENWKNRKTRKTFSDCKVFLCIDLYIERRNRLFSKFSILTNQKTACDGQMKRAGTSSGICPFMMLPSPSAVYLLFRLSSNAPRPSRQIVAGSGISIM